MEAKSRLRPKRLKYYSPSITLLLGIQFFSPLSPLEAGEFNRSPINISAEELKAMPASGGNFKLVDVRQEWEYHRGHVSGAELIPLDQIRQGKFILDKEEEIVLYCRSGRRSAIAAKILADSGYTNVKNLEGATGPELQLTMDSQLSENMKTDKKEVVR